MNSATVLMHPHSLAGNNLAGETAYINKSKVEGPSFEVGAKVVYEGRDMTVSKAPDNDGDIKMVDLSGILALSASLPQCESLASLKCAAAGLVSPRLSVQRPMNTCTLPAPGSLFNNGIGAEGGKAVADVLPQTKLTSLKCAHPHS